MIHRRHLHHKTPGWIESGALFHVRLRVSDEQSLPPTDLCLSRALLAAARDYHERGKWWCELLLLMPDHLDALIVFTEDPGMPATMKNWKRAVARLHGVKWQSNFFDHRIRNTKEGNETWHYIRRNPVVKGLCEAEGDWPHWWSGVATCN